MMHTVQITSADLADARSKIKTLAVAYEAFCEANRDNNNQGRAVWGNMLKEAQDALGVHLLTIDSDYLDSLYLRTI